MADRITVEIDQELEDLIPTYLGNVRKNIEKVREHMTASDFESIRFLGHNMKGSGGGYGFDFISVVGKDIKNAARASDPEQIKASIAALEDYLARIDIHFV